MAEALLGFWAVNNPTGRAPRIRDYPCAAATVAYDGAPMVLLETGLVTMAPATVVTTSAYIGVCAAAKLDVVGTVIKIYDDPAQEFLCTSANVLTADTAWTLFFDITNPASQNAATGRSAAQLGTSATAQTQDACMIISRLAPQFGNTHAAGPNGDVARYHAKFTGQQHWLSAPALTGAA